MIRGLFRLALNRKATRAAAPPPIETPAAIQARALDLARAVWSAAVAQAEQRVAEVQARAAEEVAAARADLAQAEELIAKHEAQLEQQAQQIATAEQTITQLRGELDQARGAAQVAQARAAELVQRVADLKAELAQAQQLAAARWSDELAAIKQQLQAQAATIAQLRGPDAPTVERRGRRRPRADDQAER